MLYGGLSLGVIVAIAMVAFMIWDRLRLDKIDETIAKVLDRGGSRPLASFHRRRYKPKATHEIDHWLKASESGRKVSAILSRRHNEFGEGDFILRVRAQRGFETFQSYLEWASDTTPELRPLLRHYADWISVKR